MRREPIHIDIPKDSPIAKVLEASIKKKQEFRKSFEEFIDRATAPMKPVTTAPRS